MVGAPLGKSERGPRTTSRRSWGSRWWPAAVAPRRGADGGGLDRGGAAPARERGRGVVGELHRDTRELLVWSV